MYFCTLFSHNRRGFTLMELLVSIAIGGIALSAVSAVYIAGQQSYEKNAASAELQQNARVVLDVITRDVRQAQELVTALPVAEESAVGTLEFQDGHDPDTLTYIRYYLDGDELYRRHLAYAFGDESATYVSASSRDIFGERPDEVVLADKLIGELVSALSFWGGSPLVRASVSLSARGRTLELRTAVFGPNL